MGVLAIQESYYFGSTVLVPAVVKSHILLDREWALIPFVEGLGSCTRPRRPKKAPCLFLGEGLGFS